MENIRYLTNKDIDKEKWDNCIDHAANGLIYGYSFYLDAMAKNWDALVLNDYEAVMPLTWNRKYGISYLYQPPFLQQLGLFYKKKLSPKTITEFLHFSIKKFRFIEIALNYQNNITGIPLPVKFTQKNNFIIPLNTSYTSLHHNYSAAFKKSLRRVQKFNFIFKQSINYTNAITLHQKLYGTRVPNVTKKDYKNLDCLCKELLKKKMLFVAEVYTATDELLGVSLLLKDSKRIYNLISCILPNGKIKEANYFLYNSIIHFFSGSNLLFDLEGSDLPGVAFFYRKMGPLNQPYPFIKMNRLPQPVKFFKR
jgi:hypothetical protein